MSTTQPRSDLPPSRILRIGFTVLISLFLMVFLGAYLWPQAESHSSKIAGWILLSVIFFFPLALLFVGVLSSVLFAFDRRAFKGKRLNRWQTIVLVLCLMLGVLEGFLNTEVGNISLFLLIYWLLTGRVAGRAGWSVRHFARTPWDEKLYLIVMVGALSPIVYSLISMAPRVFYNRIHTEPTPRGIPEFRVEYDHYLTRDVDRALLRFPDIQSCLAEGANAQNRAELIQIDWDKIVSTGDATVCSFRLLHEWGGVLQAAEWMEAQGFEFGEINSPTNPYVTSDGTMRVDGRWSIRENGPRFPTTGLVPRFLNSVGYLMTISATFDAEGKELLYLRLLTSTL
ncbi:hypothetical protein AB9F26_21595 [Falsihalocynthiibacter sp. BN13B15]|uniref:hypothetical protein n=1 Tax=Falsihalocynthiibacter sp. BN13B15 TaxID=3240871 RepID=UPI00350FAB1F